MLDGDEMTFEELIIEDRKHRAAFEHTAREGIEIHWKEFLRNLSWGIKWRDLKSEKHMGKT